MSGAKRLGLVAAFLDGDRRSVFATGSPVLKTIGHWTPTRCSRSARSPRCSPRSLFADMVRAGRGGARRSRGKFLPASVKMPDFEGGRSPCSISRPTRRACRGCRPISRRKIPTIPTSITPPSGSTTISRTTSSLAPEHDTNTPISVSACLATSSNCARARATRSSSSREFARRSAWTSTRITLSSSMQRTSGARPRRGARAGRKLGLFGAGRRRRAPLDGERSVEVSPDVHGPRRMGRLPPPEAGACRAPSKGQDTRLASGWFLSFAVRRRSGLEGWRHRRLCNVHRLFDQGRGETAFCSPMRPTTPPIRARARI